MVLLIKGKIPSEEKNPIARFFIRIYRPVIRFALRYPAALLIGCSVLILATILPVQRILLGKTFLPFVQIGSEFMPPLNEGDLLYMPSTLPGVSPQKAKELLQETDRIIASFPEVESVLGKIGRAETATDPAPLSMLETMVILKPKSEWRKGLSMRDLIREMDDATKLPGLTNLWTMPIKNRTDMLATGIKTPVGIKVAGPDLRTLERIGEQIELALRSVEGTRSAYAERVMGGSFLDIDINRKEASRYGLTTGDVQDIISTAIGGQIVTRTVEGLERYGVNVRYPRDLRDDPSSLRNVLVPISGGASVPLGQLASLSLVDGPPMIKSENARPNAWIYVDIEDGVDLGSYVERAKEAVLVNVKLPPGYSLKWSGQFEYMERANRRLAVLIPITLVIIFFLLFVHFKNVTQAVILLATLPFAVIGAVWLMVFMDFNMSIAVGVGLIAVSGLAAETGVVMQLYLNEAIHRYQNEGRLKTRSALIRALEEGAVQRVRPILLTVFTTIIGLLPIMIGTGPGSEVMKRLATPMVGGLITSTVLSLVLIPSIYAIVYGARLKRTSSGIQT